MSLAAVEDIVAGCVDPAHEATGDVARSAALAAGFPDTAAGAIVNRFCVAVIRLAAPLTRGVRWVPEINLRWRK